MSDILLSLNLVQIRQAINAVDEEIVKYTAATKQKTDAPLDEKYYDDEPGDEVMEQKI